MTFTSGGTTLCVATLAATSCHTVATLTPATYPVTAAYSGDTLNAPATATGAQFTVIKADTHITVTVSPASTIRGQTVTVSVGGLPPGVFGTITFTSVGLVLCTATLPALSCTTTINFNPGTYPVTATYSGDPDYNGSTAGGSGQDGVLSVVEGIADPSTGAGPMGQRGLLGAAMVILGTGMMVVSRGRRRRNRKI